MKYAVFLLCIPGLLFAEAKVLVDAIPSGGTFLGASPVDLPFHDAATVEVKSIEDGLSGAVAGILRSAKQNQIDYICLLSAPGDNPVEVSIAAAGSKLKLSRKNTAVTVLFYRGGVIPSTPIVFSTAKTEPKKPQVSAQFNKISVPPGVTTAGWIYFNLSRLQADATKAGADTIFFQTNGSGVKRPVVIPGMKEPLIAFDDEATFTAAWYIDPKTEAALKQKFQSEKNTPAGTSAEPPKPSP